MTTSISSSPPAAKKGCRDSGLPSSVFLVRTGLTYRQVDYWTNRGVLCPVVAANGLGTDRLWDEAEIGVAIRLRELRSALGAGETTPFVRIAALLRDPASHAGDGWVDVIPGVMRVRHPAWGEGQ